MRPAAERPLWRSLLFVPVNRQHFVDKAHARRADAVILDLEDGVPERERRQARTRLPEAIAKVGRAGASVLVRVNNTAGQLEADLEAMGDTFPAAILVPKVSSGAVLRRVASWLEQRPEASSVGLVALIESASGLLAAADVAAAAPRNVALILSSRGFAHDTGMQAAGDTLQLPKQLALIAARASGLVPLGLIAPLAGIRDLAAASAVARQSRRFGFEGATCIHPDLVPVLNLAFSPTPEEVARAERTVEEFELALSQGHGARELDGRVVDRLAAAQARALLERHAQAVERDAL